MGKSICAGLAAPEEGEESLSPTEESGSDYGHQQMRSERSDGALKKGGVGVVERVCAARKAAHMQRKEEGRVAPRAQARAGEGQW